LNPAKRTAEGHPGGRHALGVLESRTLVGCHDPLSKPLRLAVAILRVVHVCQGEGVLQLASRSRSMARCTGAVGHMVHPGRIRAPMNVRGLGCAALLVVETAGCIVGDAVFFAYSSAAQIEIAPMQANVCPRDCSKPKDDQQQLSPLMVLTIEGFEDGGPSGQLVPGTYLFGQS
jgi:hypothetical protein